jgi:hypothetical protein
MLAAVLAATVWAGVLTWHASLAAPAAPSPAAPSPAAPGSPSPAAPSPAGSRPPDRAQARHPRAVIHMARARQHRRRQRIAQAAADTVTAAVGGAAVGLHFRWPPGTSQPPTSQPGSPDPGPAGGAGWANVPGIAQASSCLVRLLTSQVFAGDPAYIAASAVQTGSPEACEAIVETSADGGQTWTPGTPVTLPANSANGVSPASSSNGPSDLGNACAGAFNSTLDCTTEITLGSPVNPPGTPSYRSMIFAITGPVYDGPGHLGKACIGIKGPPFVCTAAISLGSGDGTPPDPALPASTNVGITSAGDASVTCMTLLNSTTIAKGSGTLVDGELTAGSSGSTTSSRCEGWLETSADLGVTWQAASPPVIFQAPKGAVTYHFIGTIPDGPGLLARACVEAPTVSKTPSCSSTW